MRIRQEHTDEVKSDQRDKVTISGTEYHHSEIKTVEERLDIRGALRHASTALDATPYVELKNMIVDYDLTSDVEYHKLLVDTRDELSKFGELKRSSFLVVVQEQGVSFLNACRLMMQQG